MQDGGKTWGHGVPPMVRYTPALSLLSWPSSRDLLWCAALLVVQNGYMGVSLSFVDADHGFASLLDTFTQSTAVAAYK